MQIQFNKKDPFLRSFFKLQNCVSDDELIITLKESYKHAPALPQISIEKDTVTVNIPYQETRSKEQQGADEYLYTSTTFLAKNGLFEEAKNNIKILLNKNRAQSDLHRICGQIYFEEKEYEVAIKCFVEGLKYDPQNSGIRMMMGNVYLAEWKSLLAKKLYKRAIHLDPENVYALSNYGVACLKEKDSESILEWEEYLLQAFKLDPSYMINNLNLVAHYYNIAENQKAFKYAIKVFKHSEWKNIPPTLIDIALRSAEELANDLDILEYVQDLVKEIETIGGKPIVIRKTTVEQETVTLNVAEQHESNKHLVWYLPKGNYKIMLIQKLEQLKRMILSRDKNKNKIVRISDKHLSNFVNYVLKKDKPFVRKFKGNRNELIEHLNSVWKQFWTMIANQSQNIFSKIVVYKNHPKLRPLLFLSLYYTVKIYIDLNNKRHDPRIQQELPNIINHGNSVINTVSALLLRDMFWIDLLDSFKEKELLDLAQDLYDSCLVEYETMEPGDEHQITLDRGKQLQASSYFTLISEEEFIKNKSTFAADIISDFQKLQQKETGKVVNQQIKEYTDYEQFREENIIILSIEKMTNPNRDNMNMRAVMHCVSALYFFENKHIWEVAIITAKMTERAASGISFKDDEAIYAVDVIPNKKFTWLQYLSYMFVGYQIAMPKLDSGINFHDEYQFAKKIFESHKKN